MRYFLDTSAIAKRYHRETGTEYVDRILEDPGTRCVISPLSLVELESVVATKVRTGEIDPDSLEIIRRCFRADVARERLMIGPALNERHLIAVRRLLMEYGASEGLRTLDALQLAVALDLRRMAEITSLVAADQRLCKVAAMAGCPAVNPEKPGSVLV